jgi:hypothetical protein
MSRMATFRSGGHHPWIECTPCARHGSHRCHAVVLEGRISVLGDGGGEVQLSRTIFGHTKVTSVEIAGRDDEGGAVLGYLR